MTYPANLITDVLNTSCAMAAVLLGWMPNGVIEANEPGLFHTPSMPKLSGLLTEHLFWPETSVGFRSSMAPWLKTVSPFCGAVLLGVPMLITCVPAETVTAA